MVTKTVFGCLHTVYTFIHLIFVTIFPVEKSLKNKVILVSTKKNKNNNYYNKMVPYVQTYVTFKKKS